MYTECNNCETLFRVSAENLRTAMGMVRCTQCSTLFNALEMLKDEHEVDASKARDIEDQLPTREMGDTTVIDADFLKKQDWYQDAGDTNRFHEAELTRAILEGTEPPTEEESKEHKQEWEASGNKIKEPLLGRMMRGLLGQTFTLALRNLTRHARRTALGLGTIGFGVIALLLAGGFAEWMMWMERESTIHSRLGHIQIVKDGYFKSGVADPYNYLIDDGELDLSKIEALGDVKALTPRIAFSGLISKDETTITFLGEGVRPETETDVSREVIVHAGEDLTSEDRQGMILGKGLAASLGAEVGDTVVLLTTAEGGGISAVEGTVRGIFHTAVKAYDDVALRTTLPLAQELAKAEGVHQYIVLLDETEKTDAVLGQLAELVPTESKGLELIPWIDLADFYKAIVELFSAQTSFVRLVIGIIIVLTISNTLVMSVMERTGEIGTLMALGITRKKIMKLFLSEGFVIGLVGGLLGTALGVGLAMLISYIGIPMPPAPGMDHGFTAAIRITNTLVYSGFFVALISAVLASVYPAWKASRLEIVDALRHSK